MSDAKVKFDSLDALDAAPGAEQTFSFQCPCDGQLGYFQWRPATDRSAPEAALPWMLPKAARAAASAATRSSAPDLFG